MARVKDLRPKVPESEKITVNLGHVDLGQIDLMVRNGFYSNRTDFIRTAIRSQLDRNSDLVRHTLMRDNLFLGLRTVTRAELEAARDAGAPLRLQVLGLATIDQDVSPELARVGIASLQVLGTLQATAAVKAALSDRIV